MRATRPHVKPIAEGGSTERGPARSARRRFRSGTIPVGLLRFLPAVLLGALLVPSCDDESTKPPADLGTEIVPLAVGNKWIYDWSQADSVTGVVEIDGRQYYQMAGASLIVAGKPAYVRTENNKLLAWWEPDGDHVLFDFGAEPGSTWVYATSGNDTITVTLLNMLDSTAVPAGTFRNCYTFYYHIGCCDRDWGWNVAPGIGVARFAGGKGVVYELVEFIEAKE